MTSENFTPDFLAVEEHDGIPVVRFTRSHLNEEQNIEQMGREIQTLVEGEDGDRMILDLEGVEYFTSSVVGKIIALHRRMQRENGRLVICNVGASIEKILATGSLLKYFDIVDDVPAAIESLAGEA